MRKIALVGTASSGCGAPYNDLSFEIWGVSARAQYVTRANRWFELHRLDGEAPEWAKSWRKAMTEFTHDIGEVLMFWPETKLAPKVTAYPYNRIAERFGTYFMTSSFSWMMALAIDEMRPLDHNGHPVAFHNGDEISIYGVDMEQGTEYRHQRPGFRHFIDIARILGIIVTRDVAGGLIHEPSPYPFWQDDSHINKLERRNNEIKGGISKIINSLETTKILLAQDRAALAEMDAMKLPDYDAVKRHAFLEKEIIALSESAGTDTKNLIAHEAVDAEQQWHLDYLRP